MNKMFEEIVGKLRTIDTVLDGELFTKGNRMDKSSFDPTKAYTPKEIEIMMLYGVDSAKILGNERKYLLLEVTLEEGEKIHKELYLKGFDMAATGHQFIAQMFLNNSLAAPLGNYFQIPYGWPIDGESWQSKPLKSVVVEGEGVKLTVTAVGGGKYDLKDQRINLRGHSRDFGPVPQPYRSQLLEKLELLTQKPAFQGYQINVESFEQYF